MRKKLLDISAKIDLLTVVIYEVIASVADKVNVKFFMVGATARDLVFYYGYGIKAHRRTMDVGLAVNISGWGEFEKIKRELIRTEQFIETKSTQRLQYKERIPVDNIPFGAI